MESKIIEYWSYKGFNVVIDAEFETNVFDFDLVNGVKHYDVVHLRLTVHNPIKNKETVRNKVARAHDNVIEYRWFRDNITEQVTILQDYEHKLAELGSYAVNYAKEQIYNKKVTDGLPDSLKEL